MGNYFLDIQYKIYKELYLGSLLKGQCTSPDFLEALLYVQEVSAHFIYFLVLLYFFDIQYKINKELYLWSLLEGQCTSPDFLDYIYCMSKK